MKKMAIFLCLMGMALIGWAQAPAHLKGPAAKNYKAWQHQHPEADQSAVAAVNKKHVTGPAAKNRPAYRQAEAQELQVVSTDASRPKLMGPQYKNRRSLLPAQLADEVIAQDEPTPQQKKPAKESGDE